MNTYNIAPSPLEYYRIFTLRSYLIGSRVCKRKRRLTAGRKTIEIPAWEATERELSARNSIFVASSEFRNLLTMLRTFLLILRIFSTARAYLERGRPLFYFITL